MSAMIPADKIAFWQKAFCAAIAGTVTTPDWSAKDLVDEAAMVADLALEAADKAAVEILNDAGIYL